MKRKLKPDVYWQGLTAQEKQDLSIKTGKSYNALANLFNGGIPVSPTTAVLIVKCCNNEIDGLDIISPANKQAFFELMKKK